MFSRSTCRDSTVQTQPNTIEKPARASQASPSPTRARRSPARGVEILCGVRYKATEDMADDKRMMPYRHPSLVVRQDEPFNAEPPLNLLRQAFVTPQNLFFVRNHGPVPEIDAGRYRLKVTGAIRSPFELSLGEIQRKFPKQTVMATLQCAGIRRDELMVLRRIVGEVPWSAGTISNAVWGGAALREILKAAKVEDGARHVAVTGLDEVERHGEEFGFGGSISIEKAMSPEVLLAYEMDGGPLPLAHGFPLRLVVPGYIGARSVKWLSGITVQTEPSANYFQAHAYKLFPPEVSPETADWARGITLEGVSINSAICQPGEGDTLTTGPVQVRGYAIGAGGQPIKEVEVSVDGGRTWVKAELGRDDHSWVWRFWETTFTLTRGSHQLIVRATDSAGNTQPREASRIWNFKGYMNNARHKVNVQVS